MAIYALELIEAVRRQLDDLGGDTGAVPDGHYAYWQTDDTGCLWTNLELTYYLNQTLRELGQRQPLLDGAEQTDYQIELEAGTRQYELLPEIVRIHAVHRLSDGAALLKATVAEMHRGREAPWQDRDALPWMLDPNWRATTGWPTHYLLDERRGYLSVYPAPAAGMEDTLQLEIYRTYLTPVLWSELADEETPTVELEEIPDHYEDVLVAGICARAYRKRDADTYAPKLAAEFELEFTRRAGPPRSLHHLDADARWSGFPGAIVPRAYFAR